MSNLPALPDDVDPNAHHVEFYTMQCRECGEFGSVAPVADKNHPAHLWDLHHNTATGHTRLYKWTLTRNTGEIWSPRKTRRALGRREV